MSTAVVAEAVKMIPVVGDVLSAMLTYVDSRLKDRAKLEELWQPLQDDLRKLSDGLNKVAVNKPDLVRALQGVVEEFQGFFKDNPKQPSLFMKGKIKDKFWDHVKNLEAQIKTTSFLMTAEIVLLVAKIDPNLEKILEQNFLSHNMLGDIKENVTKLQTSVDMLLETGPNNGRIQLHSEQARSALAVYRSAGNRSDNEKHDAKQTLLNCLKSWTNQQDALTIALVFVCDDGDDDKLAGLDILVLMSEDDKKRQRLFDSGEALEVLLETARGDATNAATKLASQCLINLVKKEPAEFFKYWEGVNKSDRVVKDVGLMKQIVTTADASIHQIDPTVEENDDKALCVLAELAGVEVCKPPIAKAGGIKVLVKLYYFATENMSTAKTEATVSNLALLAIDALASLAMDATCRATFAEEDGASIRPLAHFLWSCAALSTMDGEYEYWFEFDYNDWDVERGYGPVLTPFGTRRIDEEVWRSETAASKALCALLGDQNCRDSVTKLGTFIDMKSGKLGPVPQTRNCLWGWVAFANQVVEGMKDIKKALPWDGSVTDDNFLKVAGKAPWPSDREALGPGLVHAVWNLVDDSETKSGLQAVRNLMEGVSRASVLGFFLLCGQFEVLDYNKLLDSSVVIKSTLAIKWAEEYEGLMANRRAEDTADYFWAACVLMNALTLESPSEKESRERHIHLSLKMTEALLGQKSYRRGWTGDKKLFVPLVERWVSKTRRSDMDEKCIPFLDIGARQFTSPAKVKVGDGSDTSMHSGSSQGRSTAIERDPRRECVARLAQLWPDHEDTIRKECSAPVVREVYTLLPADVAIEVVLEHDDHTKPRTLRVKVNGDGTVGDLKKLVAKQVGTLPEKIQIVRHSKAKKPSNIDQDDRSLRKSRILDSTKLHYTIDT